MISGRRQFLRAIGAGALASLAGCLERVIPEPSGNVAFPGTDSIGFSYDVFEGEFASPGSTRIPLFDLGNPEAYETATGTYGKPRPVRVQWLEDTNILATSGTRARDYQSALATRAGLKGEYGFFKGSLEAQFNEVQRRSTVFNFVTQTDQYNIALLTIDPDRPVRDLLRPGVVDDLANMDPETLFDTYGTHYLHSLVVGASATYSAATNTTRYESEVDLTVAAEMSYRGATGQLSADSETRYSEAIAQFRKSSTIRVNARGGRAEFAGKIVDGLYDDWRESVRDHMAFVSIRDDSLRPIWDLAADAGRRAELERAFNSYALRFGPELAPTIAPVYGYTADGPRSWYYSLSRSDKATNGWRFHDDPFFYVSTEPLEGMVPVYRHSIEIPLQYRLTVDPAPGHPWSEETDPVWYAYPPDAGDAPGRVAIYGHTPPNRTGAGYFYNVRAEPRGWTRRELAFYAADVDVK